MLTIHPDIQHAETPPAWLYLSDLVYETLRNQLFARSWQYLAPAEVLKMPGSVYPATFLEGCVNEPLLLIRDTDDSLRCISNTCTHRGALVVSTPGRLGRNLQCPYHGRRWDNAGKFQHMPEFQAAEGFPRPCEDLKAFHLREWGGLLFAALDPFVPFEEWIAPVTDWVGWLPLSQFRFDPTLDRDYRVAANWALYCDNYLEGFHIPFVHPSLNQALDYANYRTELYPYCNLQVGIGKGAEHCFSFPAGHPHGQENIAGLYFWLYPNLMLNYYPWGLSLNLVRPLGPAQTRVSFRMFVHNPNLLETGAGADLDKVEREDEVVVESVQRGLQASAYTRGRYSPTREQGVHHFHRLLSETLNT
jgi:choline monooxygenase